MKEESAHESLRQFWPRMSAKVDGLTTQQFRVDANWSQELPLARIKKIMKLDETVQTQMISAEAPVLFAVASEMFIQELTLRAWCHVEDNKRKTLQKNDVAMAIARNEQFDFLIDIVPREEVKNRSLPPKPEPPPVPAQSMEGLQVH